jgi:hypothetical protein
LAREVGDRHEFDRGDPQLDQIVQTFPYAVERPLGREGADVKFVEDDLFPWPTAPARILPPIFGRIDDLAGTVDIVRLIPGPGIGNSKVSIDPIAITRSGSGFGDGYFIPTVVVSLQGNFP